MSEQSLIKKIRKIIDKYGSFTVADVMADSSPIINSMKSCVELAEEFYIDKVISYIYNEDGNEINSDFHNYEELPKDCIERIAELAEKWEVDCIKTEKRIS